MNDTCAGCTYFKEVLNKGLGSCLRFPEPVKKLATDWCGEHCGSDIDTEPIELTEQEEKDLTLGT